MQINVIEYLENTLKKFSTKTAVIEGDNIITFKELNEKSKSLACEIIRLSNIPNLPIAVFLPKSINSVIADLAITFSGNVYMNLDVKTPLERIKNIVHLIKPTIIITNAEYFENLSQVLPASQLIDVDAFMFPSSEYDEQFSSILGAKVDTDPYCIINTSGSTGTPKGVVLNHKSFIDFMEWTIETFGFSENEVIGSLSPLVFDIYSFELCMLMARGSTVVLIPDHLAAFPVKILNILNEYHVSFLFWVPTIMVNIANMDLFSAIQLPYLKTVWFAGEVFPTKQFNYWKKNLLGALFVNLYGPIEITLDCTYFIVNREIADTEPLPIGFPCRNTAILILNDKDEPIRAGEEGELCVRGTSLAMGYYNNPEKTAAVFVQNPLNKAYPEIIYRTGDVVSLNDLGEIVFKGRKDSLVKHLGYRVELGEIEHVIVNTLKIVKNGCVVYNFGKKQITLFYEAKEDIPVAEFRTQILNALPKYMIPSVFIRMNELPRNTNGKIDRLQLKNSVIDA